MIWSALEKYGRSMSIYSAARPELRKIRAFIQPERPEDYAIMRRETAPGTFDRRTYLFIAAPEAIEDGETDIVIVCGGIEYELLRAELMTIGDEGTHWEGVMRPIGRVRGDV